MLQMDGARFIASGSHEGKVIVVLVVEEHSATGGPPDIRLRYSVRRDGSELADEDTDGGLSAVPLARWEPFRILPLPDDADDESVLDHERTRYGGSDPDPATQLLRSRYRSAGTTQLAPVRLVSTRDHLYVFRRSGDRVLVDRFVLDALNNRLIPALELRYRTSRMRYRPVEPNDDGDAAFDTLSTRDRNGGPFFEPSLELGFLGDVTGGCAVDVVAAANDVRRWHFATVEQDRLVLTSVQMSEAGWFELCDGVVPAIVSEVIALPSTPTGPPEVAAYSVQREASAAGKSVLLKIETRLMVTVPTEDGIAAFDFGVHLDGTLAEVAESTDREFIGGTTVDVALTLDSLAAVVPHVADDEGISDRIESVRPSPNGRVEIAPMPDGVRVGDEVMLHAAVNVDGAQTVRLVELARLSGSPEPRDGGRFHMPLASPGLGEEVDGGTTVRVVGASDETWVARVVEPAAIGQDHLIVDGAPMTGAARGDPIVLHDELDIVAPRALGTVGPADPTVGSAPNEIAGYRSLDDGSVRLRVPGHTFDDLEEVVIARDGHQLEGTHRIIDAQADRLAIATGWPRRRLVARDDVDPPAGSVTVLAGDGYLKCSTPIPDRRREDPNTVELWFRTSRADSWLVMVTPNWVIGPADWNVKLVAGSVVADTSDGSFIESNRFVADGNWHHLAVVTDRSATSLYVDGIRTGSSGSAPWVFSPDADVYLGLGSLERTFSGEIAEVRVWSVARTAEEIALGRGALSTGDVAQLAGHWPCGDVLDTTPPTIPNTRPQGKPAQVGGAVHGGLVRLPTAIGGTSVAAYRNDALVPVTAGATYHESFDVRAGDGSAMSTDFPYQFEFRGRTSRSDPDWTALESTQTAAVALDDGWTRCSASFTVPLDLDLTLVRTFGLRRDGASPNSELPLEWLFRNHRLTQTTGSLSKSTIVADGRPWGEVVAGAGGPAAEAVVNSIGALELREAVLDDEVAAVAVALASTESIGDLEELLAKAQREQADKDVQVKQAERAVQRVRSDPINASGERRLHTTIKGTQSYLVGYVRMDDLDDPDKIVDHDVEALATPETLGQGDHQSAEWELYQLDANPDHPQRVELRTTIKEGLWRLVAKPAQNSNVPNTVTLEPIAANAGPTPNSTWVALPRGDGFVMLAAHWYDAGSGYRMLDASRGRINLTPTNASDDPGEGDTTNWQMAPTPAANATLTKVGAARVKAREEPALTDARKALQAAKDVAQGLRVRLENARTGRSALLGRRTRAETALDELATELVASRQRLRQAPLADDWSATTITDRRGLTSRSTLLSSGALGVTALRALPEGDVDLIGVDRRGCVAHLSYGAVAAGPSTTITSGEVPAVPFERWQGPSHRSCVESRSLTSFVSVVDDPIELPTAPSGWTIELWYFHWPSPDALVRSARDRVMVRLVGNDVDGCHLVMDQAPGTLRLGAEIPGRGWVASPADLSNLATGWHHLAVTAEGDGADADMQFFVDGRAVGGIRPDGADATDAARRPYRIDTPVQFFGKVTGALARPRRFAEIAVWDTALSADAIAADAMVGSTGREPGLIARLAWGRTANAPVRLVDAEVVPFTGTIGNPGHLVARAGPAFPERALDDTGTVEFWVRFDHTNTDFDLQSLLDIGELDVALENDSDWHHVAVTWSRDRLHLMILVDGAVNTDVTGAAASNRAPRQLHLSNARAAIAELRCWRLADAVRAQSEIEAWMHRRPAPGTDGLLEIIEVPSAGNVTWIDNRLPMAFDEVNTCDQVVYETTPTDVADGSPTATLQRTTVMVRPDSAVARSGARVEAIDLEWVGNMQFQPTLLGYMEGAPPVPSENLTVDPAGYTNAASVELRCDHRVSRSWARTEVTGVSVDLSASFGPAIDADAAVVKAKSAFLAGGSSEGSDTRSQSTQLDFEEGGSVTDRLSLSGSVEDVARFPTIGPRFVPKNVGYAVVASGLADVFLTRLRRSGRMVSYLVKPVDDAAIDVNTVTFMINPAYTMNGCLDGRTGRQPASDRYFPNLDAMRRRYGSRYPASYFRLAETEQLEHDIEVAEKSRRAYFQNFDVTLPERAAMPDEPTEFPDDVFETLSKVARITGRLLQLPLTTAHAEQARRVWLRRTEEIKAKATKRNIVNTYVWDADGGLRAESQEFASTITQHLGHAFDNKFGMGFEVQGAISMLAGVGFELTFNRAATMSVSMSTTEIERQGFALDVDLSGVERLGVTDYRDRPLQPGEKVDRYRFKSFYLDGSTAFFDHFFEEVVDPEWLASNDEEALSLRMINREHPSKPWRVLHRVTYVERPSLLGFDVSDAVTASASSEPSPSATAEQVAELAARVNDLQEAIRRIETSLGQAPQPGPDPTSKPKPTPKPKPKPTPKPKPKPTPKPKPKPKPPTFDPVKGSWGLWPLNSGKPSCRRGARGDAVRYIQGVIFHKAGGNIGIDGVFEGQTERRVKDVQSFFKITVDGVVAAQTWRVIDSLADK